MTQFISEFFVAVLFTFGSLTGSALLVLNIIDYARKPQSVIHAFVYAGAVLCFVFTMFTSWIFFLSFYGRI